MYIDETEWSGVVFMLNATAPITVSEQPAAAIESAVCVTRSSAGMRVIVEYEAMQGIVMSDEQAC